MRTVHFLRSASWVAAVALVSVAMVATVSSSQAPKEQSPKEQAPKERVRVPTTHANVHMNAGSGSEVLVLVPRGTVLTVLARKGEWLQVQLSPELRKTGMVMRWYKNETSGWMHDSTVEPVDAKKSP
jgi:uncharacterized protein YgiM (DUF1202 family)